MALPTWRLYCATEGIYFFIESATAPTECPNNPLHTVGEVVFYSEASQADVEYEDLTDGGDSDLHYHASDRDRANHTGTQAAATISDFDTEVGNNTDVAANTAARHTHGTDLGLDTGGANPITAATIKGHVDNVTTNPHAVTKTQVGLGSVDNDAQLKRAAGDFASFTEKTSPISADLLLIEDSAASNAKKKIQIGNLPAGSATISSSQAGSSGTVTTTSTTDVALTGITLTPSAGTYLVMFSGVFACEENESVHCVIYRGGTKVANTDRQHNNPDIPFVTPGDSEACLATQGIVTVNGAQAIDIRWRVTGGTGTSMPEKNMTLIRLA